MQIYTCAYAVAYSLHKCMGLWSVYIYLYIYICIHIHVSIIATEKKAAKKPILLDLSGKAMKMRENKNLFN